MRILVCGGRNYGNVVRTVGNPDDEPPETQIRLKEYKFIHQVLGELVHHYSQEWKLQDNWLPTDIVIIEGGAKGVDSVAYDFAVVNYCQIKEYPADWDKYGKAAGFIRNKQMLDEGKPDLVIAFPGGKGTANMIKLARDAGVEVIEIIPPSQ